MVFLYFSRSISKKITCSNLKSIRSNMSTTSAPEWKGVDKVVRDVFPEDYQLSGAIIGGYVSLITFFVLKNKLKTEEVKPFAPTVTPTGDALPDIESPEFGALIESETNLNKWVNSWEK